MFYRMTLKYLNEMPSTATYRQATESLTKKRLELVTTEPDVTKLEQKIGSGQIEEVIWQARDELDLAKKMTRWRPWEPLVEQPPKNQWKWPV
jgi:NADH dehydrogenase (ubiquinone) 1 alpha subcomplex subunit 5